MSIKIENIKTPSGDQWESIIMGCRNPFDSWEKSDSGFDNPLGHYMGYHIGSTDMGLMKKLAGAGTGDHRKFARMIPVWMDVTAPFYWWKEADTYKVGTVANSCSTMHRIHAKPFSRDDFSCERMTEEGLENFDRTIEFLEKRRLEYLETKSIACWDDMIQTLPTSYNQKRTLFLNYEVLWNMYQARKNHKLPEWRVFCEVIRREVPFFAEIFGIEAN